MNVNGKRVLVCGMARSGIAAAKLLLSLGAQVTITDTKPEADFGGALDELRAPGCVFALGQAADALIAGQDMMIISPGIAWAKPFVQSAIAQGVEVMGELELGARLTKGALVAITGTNGKTTTTTLVGELFRAAGRTTHVVGNIGYPITATAGISKADAVTVAAVPAVTTVADAAPAARVRAAEPPATALVPAATTAAAPATAARAPACPPASLRMPRATPQPSRWHPRPPSASTTVTISPSVRSSFKQQC